MRFAFLLPASLAVAVFAAGMSGARAAPLEAAFAAAVAADGGSLYQVARDRVLAHGEDAALFLEKMAAEEDASWRQRWLAELALQRLRDPETQQRWEFGFTGGGIGLKRRDDGELEVVVYDGDASERARRHGLETGQIVPRAALPVAIDLLRTGESFPRAHACRVLVRFIDLSLIEVLFEQTGWGSAELFIPAVKKLPAGSLAVIHAMLETPGERDLGYYRTMSAINALAVIGDAESARLLIGRLANPDWKSYHDEIAKALQGLSREADSAELFAALSAPRPNIDLYRELREAMLLTGDRSRPMLLEIARNPGAPLRARAIAGGIVFEMENPEAMAATYAEFAPLTYRDPRALEEASEGEQRRLRRQQWWGGSWRYQAPTAWPDAPAPFLLESAAALRLYEPLGRLDGNLLAAQVLEEAITARHIDGSAAKAAAELLGKDALPRLARSIETDSNQHHRAAILAALLRIGHPDGAAIAEHFKRWPPAAKVAEALRGGVEAMRELLEAEDDGLRTAAIVALLGKGDVSAAPAALDMHLDLNPDAERDREGARRRAEVAQALTAAGGKVVDAIREAGADSDHPFATFVVAGFIERIEEPGLAQRYDLAARSIRIDRGHKLGPSVADFHDAGRQFADAVGGESIPLLRLSVATGEAWYGAAPHPAMAAFALAELGDVDSLELIARNAGRLGFVHNVRGGSRRGGARPTGSLGAAVLRAFGEPGIEMAKKIPPPDAEKAHFGSRAGRHRGATTALQGIDDQMGLEKILEGLALAARGDLDAKRASTYLQLAFHHEDARIIAPAAATFARYPELARVAGLALYKYSDPAVVPACLAMLKVGANSSYALQGLGGVKKGGLFDFVLACIAEEEDIGSRALLVHSLAGFRRGGEVHQLAERGGIGMTPAQVEALAPRARKQLIAHVAEGNPPSVRQRAAWGLAEMDPRGRNDRSLAALVAYLQTTGDRIESMVFTSVFASGDRDALDAMVELFRKGGDKRYELARHLVRAKRLDIVPDLVAELEAYVESSRPERSRYWHTGMLVEAGEPGREALLRLAGQLEPAGFRTAAYSSLASVNDARGYEDAKALLLRLVEDPESDPELVGKLGGALAKMSWRFSYPLIVDAALAVDNPGLQRDLAAIAAQLADRHPELARLK